MLQKHSCYQTLSPKVFDTGPRRGLMTTLLATSIRNNLKALTAMSLSCNVCLANDVMKASLKVYHHVHELFDMQYRYHHVVSIFALTYCKIKRAPIDGKGRI